MSKPKYYWYGTVKGMCMKYQELSRDNSTQSAIFVNAIQNAIEETLSQEYGEEKMKAINEVLFFKRKNVSGVAMDLYRCERTVRGWIIKFVYRVGKNAGF